MNSNPIGIVICRIGAIWLALSALGNVGNAITTLSTYTELDAFIVMSLISILATFATAFILWHYAESISSTRFPTPDLATGNRVDSSQLVMIGTHLLGIYILVLGIISLVEIETIAWMQSSMYERSESFRETMSAHLVGGRVSSALQIVLGFALLIRGKRGLR